MSARFTAKITVSAFLVTLNIHLLCFEVRCEIGSVVLKPINGASLWLVMTPGQDLY